MREVVKSSGETKQSVSYSAYGEPVVTPAAGEVELNVSRLYTGRDYERETGDYYYRARWFNSQAGRFLSEDRKGFNAGDPNFFYRYVKNKPLVYKDPKGEAHILFYVGAVAVVYAGIWLANDIPRGENGTCYKTVKATEKWFDEVKVEAQKMLDDAKDAVEKWWANF